MKRAFVRAAELAERAGNTEIRLKALWGTWAVGRGSGDRQSALTAATRYEIIADGTGDKGSIILAARMLALTHHDLGNLKCARQYVAGVLSQAPQLAPESGNEVAGISPSS
jgi:hypothetical protein